MSDLTFLERHKLEKLFRMEGGYVLDFTNRTFAEFVADSVGKNIFDPKYDYESGSKANRLRAFWTKEPNHIVAKLIMDLLEYCRPTCSQGETSALYEECLRIAERLRQGVHIPDLETLTPKSGGRDFEMLARSVRDAIERNEPEAGLDRLHTFVVKYIRLLCQKRGISVDRDKPLHSLIGEYAKHLKEHGLIESEMTERILKSSISIMEAFNRVRNEQSFAHDNSILNYNESMLILNHVASTIRFLHGLEGGMEHAPTDGDPEPPGDIPF